MERPDFAEYRRQRHMQQDTVTLEACGVQLGDIFAFGTYGLPGALLTEGGIFTHNLEHAKVKMEEYIKNFDLPREKVRIYRTVLEPLGGFWGW